MVWGRAGEGPREREEHRGESREEARDEGGGRSRWMWPRESITGVQLGCSTGLKGLVLPADQIGPCGKQLLL